MRLIRLQLKRSTPFWSTSYAQLNTNKPTSEYIDVDGLTENQIKVVEASIKRNEINVMDRKGKFISSIMDTVELNEFLVSDEDVTEDVIPEVQSVTVSMDDEEEEPIEDEVDPEIMKAEALIVVNNNGNTVKKTILAVDTGDPKSRPLVQACLQAEIGSKNRPGVIDTINKVLGECL